MFLDNCRVHHSKVVSNIWDELNIEPVWNVPYRFEFNDACEKYWAMLKTTFRPLLLEKMLKPHNHKSTPLKDAVLEAIQKTSRDSILKFVQRGIRQLKEEA